MLGAQTRNMHDNWMQRKNQPFRIDESTVMLFFPNSKSQIKRSAVAQKLEFHSNGNDWGKVFFHISNLKVLYALTQWLLADPTKI